MPDASTDTRLGRRLVLDELFDLSLYRALHRVAPADQRAILEQLIPIETRHHAFWQDFFKLDLPRLDWGRRLKLWLMVAIARVFGAPAIHLILEAIEVFGVRKYLTVWRQYEHGPLGAAVREVLEDEFKHEDAVVMAEGERQINPQRVRDIFLGLNDGLVEILGAVSGFFGAFADATTVLVAGLMVGVAGALSMGAGAYLAGSSEAEVRSTEARRGRAGRRIVRHAPRLGRPGRGELRGRRGGAGAAGGLRSENAAPIARGGRGRDRARVHHSRVSLGHGREAAHLPQPGDHRRGGRDQLRHRAAREGGLGHQRLSRAVRRQPRGPAATCWPAT
jgi:VIT family protein